MILLLVLLLFRFHESAIHLVMIVFLVELLLRVEKVTTHVIGKDQAVKVVVFGALGIHAMVSAALHRVAHCVIKVVRGHIQLISQYIPRNQQYPIRFLIVKVEVQRLPRENLDVLLDIPVEDICPAVVHDGICFVVGVKYLERSEPYGGVDPQIQKRNINSTLLHELSFIWSVRISQLQLALLDQVEYLVLGWMHDPSVIVLVFKVQDSRGLLVGRIPVGDAVFYFKFLNVREVYLTPREFKPTAEVPLQIKVLHMDIWRALLLPYMAEPVLVAFLMYRNVGVPLIGHLRYIRLVLILGVPLCFLVRVVLEPALVVPMES